jgi:hypothetical protein
MTEKDDFLSRWSRRKQEAARETKLPRNDEVRAGGAEQSTQATAPDKPALAQQPPEAEPAFDLSKLPSLDSIGPDSDVRLFMQPGVPASLSHAALRRAWSADPAIRDFIGLSENAWDFTKPETIAGFGPLLPVDDVKRLLSKILKDESDLFCSEDEPSQTALQQPETAEETKVSTTQIATSEQNFEGADSEPEPRDDAASRCTKDNLAPQQKGSTEVESREPSKPRHGGALPT